MKRTERERGREEEEKTPVTEGRRRLDGAQPSIALFRGKRDAREGRHVRAKRASRDVG